MNLKAQIGRELYRTIQTLGGSGQLLSIVGSYGDTLDDDDVLALLRSWNDRHSTPLAPVNQT
jgi:hypothetical protein